MYVLYPTQPNGAAAVATLVTQIRCLLYGPPHCSAHETSRIFRAESGPSFDRTFREKM